MSLLSDPAYIVHNLRLSNLRLDDRTADKIISFPPQLLSNEYIKVAGPNFPEMQYCYSPNISHEYMMLGSSSLLLGGGGGTNDSTLTPSNDGSNVNPGGTTGVAYNPKPGIVGRIKHDRRRMVAAQAAAAAGLGRGGNEGGSGGGGVPQVSPIQPAPAPAVRVPIPMAAASVESDDEIDIDDEEPIKSPPRRFPKIATPILASGNFAPGIFVTTPSRPGSATIPEDTQAAQRLSAAEGTGTALETAADSAPLESGASRDSEAVEQTTEIGDITIDSLNSPIDLSPPASATAGRLLKTPVPSVINLMSSSPLRPDTPPPNKSIAPHVEGLPTQPFLLPVKPPPKSLLTQLITQQKFKDDNPFAEEFLRVAGMGEANPVQLKIYLPNSEKPRDPMQVVVKREATVEDVIGYILYQYYHEGRKPLLSDELSTVVQWNLRIVEDDGEIDDDLPAVERTLKIGRFSTNQRFAMNQFALCEATPAQVKINENLYAKSGRTVVRPKKQKLEIPPAVQGPSDFPKSDVITKDMSVSGILSAAELAELNNGGMNGGGASSGAISTIGTGGGGGSTGAVAPPRADPLISSTQHYVRVRLQTKHEVKHTTTVEILPKMLVSGVIDYICGKRKMNPEEWCLVVADTNRVLPLDGAAEDIPNTTELALVPKDSEMILAAKRSKLGHPGLTEIPGSSVSYLTSAEVYREYTLSRKRRGGYVGHHEQVLAIDGDYIRIMPSSTKMLLFDSGKTSSYVKNMIHDCRQSKKARSHFKLIVIRGDRETKTYEFEANSPQQAQEICQRIMQLKNS
ncbi:stress-activated map kinase interacting protein 1-domain-containing protein [Lobosporangium transversale]|uniref:Stress-activated map kinase interacting protein 1-domain-containing protein n=1 Tax=Lobosporangium transversale TaxID=64571 RepID=A0A1Y2G7R5_9FUNG|nr:stress-activated map kinase interacting protein 1-domain-containing protein [Lobosporangium transversale]ORZ00058.1 stress-activated map kinase interacting protein 1-domain-containing protein [Lobosporangium transversale]|eukprot:XP_021876099.1 stress-activated map kinase interacting protein 1-domain-containing protein [Lobosporangium transversale]